MEYPIIEIYNLQKNKISLPEGNLKKKKKVSLTADRVLAFIQ